MALEPMGHARRCCHRGFDARRLLARESAEYESVRRPATSTVGVRAITCCGCGRRSAEGACLAELAKREDSCLNIIVLPSANGGDIVVVVAESGMRNVVASSRLPSNVVLRVVKLVAQKSGSGSRSLMSHAREASASVSASISATKARLPYSLRVRANIRRSHFISK